MKKSKNKSKNKSMNQVNDSGNHSTFNGVPYVKYAVAVIAFVIIVVMGYLLVATLVRIEKPRCTTVNTIDASLTVHVPLSGGRGIIGFNTDQDSLKFGAVSPGLIPQRNVNVQYSRNAHVSIAMTGQLALWTQIEPSEFDLVANQSTKVQFFAHVPSSATGGDYTGKAVFCFQEK